MRHRNGEWHVTVKGDPFQWRGFCTAIGIKPLWIELNNFETQLMCAAHENPQKEIFQAGWEIIRVKHEVETFPIDITCHQDQHRKVMPEEIEGALYYECHVKIDGPFQPGFPMSSRDLYRHDRWYVTKREARPFDPGPFASVIARCINLRGKQGVVDEYEYEAALIDSNHDLDARWL
jgi:hypothetical protein